MLNPLKKKHFGKLVPLYFERNTISDGLIDWSVLCWLLEPLIVCPSPPPLQKNRCPNWRRGREGPAQGAAPAGGGGRGPGFRTVSVTSTRTSWPRSEPSSYRSDLGSGLWNQVSALCSPCYHNVTFLMQGTYTLVAVMWQTPSRMEHMKKTAAPNRE